MDRITLRLPPDLVRRFDAAAAGQGGRSRLLRRLMENAAQAPLLTGEGAPVAVRTGKLTLRLGEADPSIRTRAKKGKINARRNRANHIIHSAKQRIKAEVPTVCYGSGRERSIAQGRKADV